VLHGREGAEYIEVRERQGEEPTETMEARDGNAPYASLATLQPVGVFWKNLSWSDANGHAFSKFHLLG
jgi:hypothetical protein